MMERALARGLPQGPIIRYHSDHRHHLCIRTQPAITDVKLALMLVICWNTYYYYYMHICGKVAQDRP